ncbi:MAG: hypothetical protein K2F88_00420, partial [Duncaniella sp.]|nr:hypothetical protein [Duncaniella sp.]
RYAPSIQIHIHLKTFAQILTIVFKQRPFKPDLIYNRPVSSVDNYRKRPKSSRQSCMIQPGHFFAASGKNYGQTASWHDAFSQ